MSNTENSEDRKAQLIDPLLPYDYTTNTTEPTD